MLTGSVLWLNCVSCVRSFAVGSGLDFKPLPASQLANRKFNVVGTRVVPFRVRSVLGPEHERQSLAQSFKDCSDGVSPRLA